MNNTNLNPKSNQLYAVLVSAVGAVVFTTFVIVASYLWPSVQSWLAKIFSHHWIGKSVLATGFFFVSLAINMVVMKMRPQADSAPSTTSTGSTPSINSPQFYSGQAGQASSLQATDEKIVRMLWKLFWFSLVGTALIFGLNTYETFLAGK
ncbi:MAG: hypothetical protein HYV65_03560 [Candidatus Spechtbacteria bacterium]|nr:hypothetical protein [Candidatus Spechtbacteria bacterium]